jgi:putative spermidine/putrescine transport system ATP-binding protein
MSDRVAVFNKGRIEQIAAPQELYTRPATAFVADFVGTSNVFDAAWAASLTGQQQAFAYGRSASVRRNGQDGDGIRLPTRLLDVQYLGAVSRYELEAGPERIISMVLPNDDAAATLALTPGQAVTVWLPAQAMHALAG